MLHMPGVVQSSPPLAADAFHMAKADDDFQFKCLRFVVFREVDRRGFIQLQMDCDLGVSRFLRYVYH